VAKGKVVHRPAAFWVVLGLLLFGFIIFLPALKQLPFDEWLPSKQVRGDGSKKNKPDEKVWVSKRSGYYYCQTSRQYGTLEPGEYMNRSQANQAGFRPAPNVSCN
jgi:hypothetical protein